MVSVSQLGSAAGLILLIVVMAYQNHLIDKRMAASERIIETAMAHEAGQNRQLLTLRQQVESLEASNGPAATLPSRHRTRTDTLNSSATN